VHSENFALTEFSKVRPRLTRSFEKSQKKAYGRSKFIGNSSGVGINVALHAHPCALREGQIGRIRWGAV